MTFMRPDQASRRWAGIPEPDVAGPIAVAAYFRAYGPATVSGFRNWLSRGLVPAKHVQSWFAELGDGLAPVSVGGELAFILSEDLEDLVASKASRTVRLLGGFDQWVLGPGTDDPHVIAPARRTDVSRQSGWIAPIVVAGGVVAGTWGLDGDGVRVAWFTEAGKPPRGRLQAEVKRLGATLDRRLTLSLASRRSRPGFEPLLFEQRLEASRYTHLACLSINLICEHGSKRESVDGSLHSPLDLSSHVDIRATDLHR